MNNKETGRDKIEYHYRTSITQSVDGVCMVEVSYKSDEIIGFHVDRTIVLFDDMVNALKEKGYPVAGSIEAAELRGKKK